MAGRWVLMVALLVPVGGCSEGEAPPQGHWVLREMTYGDTTYGDFLASVADDPVTLLVDGRGTITGWGACNGYGVDPAVGGTFPVSDVHHTMQGCSEEVLEEFDRDYFAALREVTDVEGDNDELILTGEDLRMEFEARG